MKRIVISAVITPNDDSVTLESLRNTLRHLGSAYFIFGAEVELAEVEEPVKEVWLYVSADDSEPYIQVTGPHITTGNALSRAKVDRLRSSGVCIEFHAQYPRSDRYGAPLYASDEDFAAGVVGNHSFKVHIDGLVVRAQDRGDDGCEQIWLKLAVPE